MSWTCATCDFELWHPIATLPHSVWGLYDDARYPGRSLLVHREHVEELGALDDHAAAVWFNEIRHVAATIEAVTGAERMNYALLGNAVPHIHWHLVPRLPAREPNPTASPWSRPDGASPLLAEDRVDLIERLRHGLGSESHQG